MRYIISFYLCFCAGCVSNFDSTIENTDSGQEYERTFSYPPYGNESAGCAPGTYCAAPQPKQPAIVCFPEENSNESMPEQVPDIFENPSWGPEATKNSNEKIEQNINKK